MFLAAQIIVNAFPQCARSFSVDNADTRQMGEISVIEIFVEFGNRFIHRFSEQIDLVLHNADHLFIAESEEGELSILHDTHLDEEISLRIRAGADSTFEIHA